jgi:hypothetical protein
LPDSKPARCLECDLTSLAIDNELQVVVREEPETEDRQSGRVGKVFREDSDSFGRGEADWRADRDSKTPRLIRE